MAGYKEQACGNEYSAENVFSHSRFADPTETKIATGFVVAEWTYLSRTQKKRKCYLRTHDPEIRKEIQELSRILIAPDALENALHRFAAFGWRVAFNAVVVNRRHTTVNGPLTSPRRNDDAKPISKNPQR